MEKVFGRIIAYTENNAKCIEDAINYIRTFKFHFIDTEPFFDIYPKSKLKNKHRKWQFLIRTPGQSKLRWVYDTRLFFAIKLWGNKVDKIAIYYEGKFLKTIKKEWKDRADINYRRMTKNWWFPDYMSYEQRRDWRTEHKKVLKNPKYKPSEYYLKCRPDIKWTDNPDGFVNGEQGYHLPELKTP